MVKVKPSVREWLIVAILLLVGLIAVWGLGSALMPLLVSFALAYLVFPLIKRLEGRGIQRHHAVFAVFASIVLSLILILIAVVPILARDLRELSSDFPAMASKALENVESFSGQLGYPMELSKESLRSLMQEHISELSSSALKGLSKGLKGVFSSFVGWLISILNFFLIPLFFFYVINDFEGLSDSLKALVPVRWRPTLGRYVALANEILSGYIRGQLTVALILGTLYGLGLWLIGLKFGILIGFLSGLISVIPYAGFTLGFLTAMTIGLANYTGLSQLMGIVAVFSAVQMLEGSIITPRFVGNKVGLGALATILAIIIGGNLLGFVGMLIAVPVAAISKTALRELLVQYQNTQLYKLIKKSPSSD